MAAFRLGRVIDLCSSDCPLFVVVSFAVTLSAGWCPAGHLMENSRFRGRPINFCEGRRTLADRTLPSLLIMSSCNLPILHFPQGRSSFVSTTSPSEGENFDLDLDSFIFTWVLSLRLNR